jgi:pimeloyl-ACP methyl ester carboxylesterase
MPSRILRRRPRNFHRRVIMRVPACALLLAASLLFVPATAGEEADAPPAPEAHTVSVNGMEMYFETVGEGEPLLLLHGGTQSGRMFDPFVAKLSESHRLIIPDLRGHGGSTNPGGEWSTRQFARDVLALLDHLKVERCKAIGASAGAMTLLHVATQEPERIEAMIVVGVGTYLPAECRAILAPTTADALPEAAWDALRARHKHGDEQIRALYAWVASLAGSYNDMTFTPPYLATIRARTLVVHGDRDYCFPASMAWDIYEAIPSAYLWVVPNGGHVPLGGENTAVFAETALRFLGGDWERN